MKSLQRILIGFFVFILCSSNAWAFRCGTGLVSSGDTKTKVQVTCGKPTFKESACEGRHSTTSVDRNGTIKKNSKCARKVEVWHYNCGENDYIYTLTFEDGKMTDETTEGRGHGKSDCLGK